MSNEDADKKTCDREATGWFTRSRAEKEMRSKPKGFWANLAHALFSPIDEGEWS